MSDDVNLQETLEEPSEVPSEEPSEETSEEPSEVPSAVTLQDINNNLVQVQNIMYVGFGFLIVFVLCWLILKAEKMLETYF